MPYHKTEYQTYNTNITMQYKRESNPTQYTQHNTQNRPDPVQHKTQCNTSHTIQSVPFCIPHTIHVIQYEMQCVMKHTIQNKYNRNS